MTELYDMLSSRMAPGGYTTQPGLNFNPRTLSGAGVGPIEPLQGLGGALKSRQMQMDMGNPVYQELEPYQPMQYAGKASGVAAVGIGLKGIARFMQAIENSKALKLQQQRYQELYELAIQEKQSSMATELLGKIAELKKIEADNNKTIQSYGDELNKAVAGMPEEQRGGYLKNQLERAQGIYGEESGQASIVRGLMKAGMLAPGGEQEMTEAPSMDFSSIFPDIYEMEKKKAKSTKLGQEEGAQEAWKTGGKKIKAEEIAMQEASDIRKQQQKSQAEQKFKSEEEKEKDRLALDKIKLEVRKKEKDLEDYEINKATQIYFNSFGVGLRLGSADMTPEKMAKEVLKVTNSIKLAGVIGNPKKMEVYDNLTSYGSKDAAIQAISSKPLSDETKQEAFKIIEVIPWDTLTPKENQQ